MSSNHDVGGSQRKSRWGSAEKSVKGDEKVGGGQRRQLQNLPRHRRFHRNRPTCFAKIGAILVGRHRRCRRFNEVLQLPRPWKDFAQLAQTIRRLEAGNPIPLLVHDTIFILKSAVQRRKHLAEARRFDGFSDGIGIYALDVRKDVLHQLGEG